LIEQSYTHIEKSYTLALVTMYDIEQCRP